MKQVFINIVGHNSSGKSTLAQKLASDLDMNIINGDAVRELAKKEIKFYKNADFSYKNPIATSLWRVLDAYRDVMLKTLLENNQSVIIDGSGFTAAKRKICLETAKSINKNIVTVIIEVTVKEEDLVKRLVERDKKSGDKTRWLDFYKDIRKDLFETPKQGESDLLLRYNQNNYSEILKTLKKI